MDGVGHITDVYQRSVILTPARGGVEKKIRMSTNSSLTSSQHL